MFHDCVLLVGPRSVDCGEDVFEGWESIPGAFREIGASKERLQIRCQENRHWPTSLT